MRSCAMILAASLLFLVSLVPAWAGADGTVINEVLFDPLGADTGLERIELYNGSATAENLSGWELYPDGIGYFVFPNHFSLGAKSVLTIHLREAGNDTESDLYLASSTIKTNMGNTSGSVALFSAEPRGKDTIKSFVQWGKGGETWESAASDAGLWSRGTFVTGINITEGSSVALKEDGVTGGGSGAWEVVLRPTIGQPNKSGGTSIASPAMATSSSSSGAASSSVTGALGQEVGSAPPLPTIKAYAGQDRNTVAGSIVSLLGWGIGLTDKPIESARFLWNFGDGETAEGRTVEHIFRFPGTYIIGLHVMSGEYAASDYATVIVAPNQVRIAEVVSGEAGFVRLENPSAMAIDIGGWRLEEGMAHFILPPRTRIAPRAAAALPNETTRLALTALGISPKIVLRYANGFVAETFFEGVRGGTVPLVRESSSLTSASAVPSIPSGAVPSPVKIPSLGLNASPAGKGIPNKISISDAVLTLPASAASRDEDKVSKGDTSYPLEGNESRTAHAASLGGASPESAGVLGEFIAPWMFFVAAGAVALGAAIGFLFLRMKV